MPTLSTDDKGHYNNIILITEDGIDAIKQLDVFSIERKAYVLILRMRAVKNVKINFIWLSNPFVSVIFVTLFKTGPKVKQIFF